MPDLTCAVGDKFRGCAEAAHWPAAKVDAIVAAVRHLETLADSRALTSLVAAQ